MKALQRHHLALHFHLARSPGTGCGVALVEMSWCGSSVDVENGLQRLSGPLPLREVE